jgi:hypothetical protein
MVEPNWDKINAKKRKEIMLGQAMNQAQRNLQFSLLEANIDNEQNVSFEENEIVMAKYKKLTKLFFKLNREIYDEAFKDES